MINGALVAKYKGKPAILELLGENRNPEILRWNYKGFYDAGISIVGARSLIDLFLMNFQLWVANRIGCVQHRRWVETTKVFVDDFVAIFCLGMQLERTCPA
jgi:hypothetical protein